MRKSASWMRRHPLPLLCVLLACTGFFSPTVISVSAGSGVTVSNTGGAVTVALPNVGTAATYAAPMSITTDAQGRASAITAGAAPLTSTLSGSFTITHTDGSTFDAVTGVSITLSTGTWIIAQQVRSILTTTTLGCQVITRLFDTTNSVEVTSGGTGGGAAGATNSSRVEGAFVTVSGVNTQATSAGVVVYTVTGSTTIRLEAVATAAATTKTVNTDVNGSTNLVAWQVR